MTLKFNGVLEVVEVHVHSSWVQRFVSYRYRVNNFLPYLALVKNPKIRSCALDFWPMTLKFSGFQRLSRYMFVQNFVKLFAVVHELSCAQRKQSNTTKQSNNP